MESGRDLVSHLRILASNLWWCWHPEVSQLFSELDPALWESTNHNPMALLDALESDVVESRARERALASRIHIAVRRLEDYLAQSGPRANMEAGPLHVAPVAYFCAEFGLHESLPIYSGGLGILAGDHLKASSDLGIPIVGVGLFYAMGYFQQYIDEDGKQREVYGPTRVEHLPMGKVLRADGEPVSVHVEVADRNVHAHIWQVWVGRNRLIMLDCNVPQNAPEDRQLTTQLYGGDQRTRIRQEILLGVGGVRALEALGIRPGVYHLNEGHSAFATLELCARLMEQEGVGFDEARVRVAKKTAFTTHTPVPAGHDRFPPDILEESLHTLRHRLHLNEYEFHSLGRVNPHNPHEPFCMTVLAIKMSERTNAVSHLHGRVSRAMWRELWPGRAQGEIPIHHITNGVHVPTFMATPLQTLMDRYLGNGWTERMDRPEAWAGVGHIEAGELWEAHQILKARLLDFIQRRVRLAERSAQTAGSIPGSGLDPDVLTIGFARRFATYKRADLIAWDTERFEAMINDPERPIQLVVAGKAHPADEPGKGLIRTLVSLSHDSAFKGRIVFLPDYDINVARYLVQGVDVWLNNPRRPQEACGTSGQKAIFNGVLNCSILDGWWAEAYDGLNGFAIGHGREFAKAEDQDVHDAEELYKVLTGEVIPLFYETDPSGLRPGWIERMKWAMTSLGWRFNANRMLHDYLRQAYLPAAGATTSS